MPEYEIINGTKYEKNTRNVVEYKVREASDIEEFDADILENRLNSEGEDGWELITIFNKKLFFKKTVQHEDLYEV